MSIQDHEDLDCARSSEYALRLRSGFDSQLIDPVGGRAAAHGVG